VVQRVSICSQGDSRSIALLRFRNPQVAELFHLPKPPSTTFPGLAVSPTAAGCLFAGDEDNGDIMLIENFR